MGTVKDSAENRIVELNALVDDIFKSVSNQNYSPSATYSPTYKIFDQFLD